MARIFLWSAVAVVAAGALVALYLLGDRALEAEAMGRAEARVTADMAQARARLAELDRRSLVEAARMASEATVAVELLLVPKDGKLALARVQRSLKPLLGPQLVAGVCERGRLVVSAGKDAAKLRGSLCAGDEGLQAAARLVAVSGELYHLAVAPVLAGPRIVGSFVLARNLGDELVRPGEGNAAILSGGKIIATNVRTRDRAALARSLASLHPGEIRDLGHGGAAYLAGRWDVSGKEGVSVIHLRSRAMAAVPLRMWGLRFLLVATCAAALLLLLLLLLRRLELRRVPSAGAPRAARGEPDQTIPDVASRRAPGEVPAPPVDSVLRRRGPASSRGFDADADPQAGASRVDQFPPEEVEEVAEDDKTRIEPIGTYRYVRSRPRSPRSGGDQGSGK